MRETFNFYSEGEKLSGHVYLPDGASKAPYPGIVLCGGYTGIKEVYAPDFAHKLNMAGYACIAFDYKGWGCSEGPPNRLDPHGRVSDAFAATTVLASHKGVDSGRIGVLGWSYGGATAIWLAAVDQRIRCVTSVASIGHGRRWMESVREMDEINALHKRANKDRLSRTFKGISETVDAPDILHMGSREKELWAQARSDSSIEPRPLPLEFIDETMVFHPEWVVDKISPRPILFIGAELDGVTPMEETHSLYAGANEPKKLVIIPDCGHFDIYSGSPFNTVCLESIDWFSDNL